MIHLTRPINTTCPICGRVSTEQARTLAAFLRKIVAAGWREHRTWDNAGHTAMRIAYSCPDCVQPADGGQTWPECLAGGAA